MPVADPSALSWSLHGDLSSFPLIAKLSTCFSSWQVDKTHDLNSSVSGFFASVQDVFAGCILSKIILDSDTRIGERLQPVFFQVHRPNETGQLYRRDWFHRQQFSP